MTTQNLIDWFDTHLYLTLAYFISVIVLTILTVSVVNDKNVNYLKYLMSVLVYAVTIPGILAALLTLYSLFILHKSLIDVNILVYFVPVIAMAITLFLLHKRIHMRRIPGFDRLSGLMIMIGITFFIVFVLQKTYFGIVFIGGFTQIVLVFFVLFVVIKFAWTRFTK